MDAAAIVSIARERAGLSKRELARRAGTSPAAIVKYEAGAMSPTVDTLSRILDAAGWSIEVELVARPTRDVGETVWGEMIADLLGVVDALDIHPAPALLECPRFEDVIVR